MKTSFVERIWKQVLLVIAVLLITTAVALARDMGYPAVRFRELVIMDPKVFHHERILDKLPQNTRVVFLNGDTTGLDQITRILAREKDLRVLRLFTHGSPGQVALNGEVLDRSYLTRHREVFLSLARAFAPDADILLYGCSVAQNEAGKGFVDELAQLTGVDVAASTNRTGGIKNEWALEYTTGPVEASTVNITAYPFYLANQVVITDADSGAGSLRQAILDVGVGEEITFNGNYTITLTSGQLTINKSITIIGTGAGNTVIDGNNASRVFTISAGNTVSVEGVTIQNGKVTSAYGGAGIHNSGSLILAECTISGNAVSIDGNEEYKSKGGGIYNNGTLTISSSTISGNIITTNAEKYINNEFYSNGAGIYNTGTLNIHNSTISGNTALLTGDSNDYNYYDNFSRGGGICNYGTLTVNNSTISGNAANNNSYNNADNFSYGGGIYASYGSNLTISNCTISQNSVDCINNGDGNATNYGAGVFLNAGTATVRNTILSQNTDSSSTYDYYYSGGTLTDDGYNVVEYQAYESSGGTNKTFTATTDILYNAGTWTQNGQALGNQNLGLSSTLALNDSNNGTYTLALASDSFAATSDTTGIPPASNWNDSPQIDGAYTDQRGVARTPGQYTSIGAYSANYSVTLYYYKSDADGGNWHVSSGEYTWTRCSTVDGTYENTYEMPTTANSNSVTIVDGAIVTITSSDDVTMDHLTVDDGAGLVLNTGGSLEIMDGSEATDFTVNGTLDMDGGSFTLTSGALAYGAASTLIYSDANAAQTTGGELLASGMQDVTFDNANGVDVSGNTAVNGTFTLDSGTFLTTSSNITASGETSGTGTISASGGTVTYNRSGDQNVFNGMYNAVTLSGSGTKTFSGTTTATGGVTVSGSLIVDGDGASTTFLRAAASAGTATSRVFTVEAGNTVMISDMTIRYGKVSGTDSGGGILNDGDLTLSNVAVSENTTNMNGAGIASTGTLEITNSTISSNTLSKTVNGQGGNGAGIYSTSVLTISNSTISSNIASCGISYNYTYGGGIFATGNLTITDTTISDNEANNHYHYTGSAGGGIWANNTISLENVTVESNRVRGNGGGIWISSVASSSIANSTIAENKMIKYKNVDYNGGGIWENCPLTMKNTILANNYLVNNDGVTVIGYKDFWYEGNTLTDNGYNIVKYQNVHKFNSATSILFNFTQSGGVGSEWTQNNSALPNQTLGLASTLADNGGPTETLALSDGSFAIDAIPYSAGSNTWNGSPITGGNYYDQRGVETTPDKSISIGAYSDPSYYYRSNGNVNWTTETNWQQSTDQVAWGAATGVPNVRSLGITIISGNTATVDDNVTIDQTTVQSDATLSVNSGKTLTIANGAGTDLTVAGGLTNAGVLTCADGSEVLFSGASASTITSSGTTTFKTLNVNKDVAGTALNVTGTADMTVDTALTVTRGTVSLSGWTHNLRLGGALTIGTDGRWTKHNSSTRYIQFYGSDCTFNDATGSQNLGHVKVDD